MTEPAALLLSWLLTAWLHACGLLALAWLAERLGLVRDLQAREWLWRGALLLPLLSASLALGSGRAAWQWSAPGLASYPSEPRTAGLDPTPSATRSAPPPVIVMPAAVPTAASRLTPGRDAPQGVEASAPDADAFDPAAVGARWRAALAPALPLLWLLLGASSTGLAWIRLARYRRRLRQLPPPASAQLRVFAAQLAQRAGLPTPHLVADADLASPLALCPPTIALPHWCIETLSPPQQQAMLAHEIAHLRRRDPRWRLLQHAATAFLPTPLSALALRRLDHIAERQCDAWAATVTGRGRDLAECLAASLEHAHLHPVPALAAAMASRDSALVERVRHLVEDSPMPSRTTLLLSRFSLAAILAGAALALPAIVLGETPIPAAPAAPESPTPPTPPSPPAPPAAPRLQGSVNQVQLGWFGERTTVELEGDGYALSMQAKGTFGFNTDETDIATLEDELSIETQDQGVVRSARFAKAGGRIERSFALDGEAVAEDAAARAWLAKVIPDLLRATGIDAKARVARIFARGGADAVLAEVDRIESEHVRARYLRLLFEQGTLSMSALASAVQRAAAIESDYELRRVLVAALTEQTPDAGVQRAIYQRAAGFDSDYERRLLLQAAVEDLVRAPQAGPDWVAAIDRSDSSYEHRLALESLFEVERVDANTVLAAIASAGRIDSDYEARLALQAAAQRVGEGAGVATAIAQSAQAIGSDYERRLALASLAEAMPATTENSLAVLDALEGMDSDYETRLALVALAERMPQDAAVVARYREVARGLGEYERGLAASALAGL